jgi:nucleotide-binding universal stress UspA family protein
VFERVLLGYDGSPGARQALHAAARLASEQHAELTAVIVQHHLPRFGATIGEVDEERRIETADARRLASEIQAQADEHHLRVDIVVVPGHPAHELVRIAKDRHADLIIVGHTGHAALRGVLLGSVCEHVIRHAPCPVLVTR